MACSLHYTTPAHGGWGVVKTVMLVPESYQLFVCPFACGRHGSIGAAQEGLKNRLSYLYVDQSDIIDGYDDLIIRTVPEFLSMLDRRPKVLFIFVSCLDDLIGTDHEAILRRLREIVPDVRMEFGHMNPITLGSASPPPITAQRMMYSLLDRSTERDKAVNLIGNLDNVAETSELYTLLGNNGYEIRHISCAKTFDEFQKMSRSELNIVIDPKGLTPAKEMEKKLSISYVFLPVSYDFDTIEDNYKTISDALSLPEFDLKCYREKATEDVAFIRAKIGSYPIIVDSSAAVRPYSLAKALISYGFSVKAVATNEVAGSDRASAEYIRTHHPEVSEFNPLDFKGVRDRDFMKECIAIGMEASYITGSLHPADIVWDKGMYGFDGVSKMLSYVYEAYSSPSDLKSIIQSHRLVI